jgi:hypothetical protein
MTAQQLIGSSLMHGSPGYMNQEKVSKVCITRDSVEIEFESQAYTQMHLSELASLLVDGEVSYNELTHGGASHIILC